MFIIKSPTSKIKIIPDVEIDEYISDPYFIGKSTDNGKLVYDIWKKDLMEIFAKKSITEVILTGAIGTGKTTTAVIGSSFITYKLLSMDNPHRVLGIIEKDPIVIAFINLTRSLSKSGCATKFANLMYNSPIFADLGVKFSTRTAVPWPSLPKDIHITVGSAFAQGFGVIGQNVIAGLLDEISDVKDAKHEAEKLMFSQQKALKLYRAVAKRITSRFMGKTSLAKLFLVSSKSEKDKFLEKYRKKVQDMKHVVVYDHALWEAKPERYSGKKFYVCINKLKQIKMSRSKERLPHDVDVYEIPVEHVNEFKLDPVTALADFAGISTNFDKSLFFRNKILLQKSFQLPLIHQPTYVVSMNDNSAVEHAFDIEKLLELRDKKLSIHIDTALSQDRFALGASYVDSYEEVLYTPEINTLDLLSSAMHLDADDPETIKKIYAQDRTMRIPLIKVPIAIGLETADEVPFFKVREFIMFLRNLGIKIVSITTDGYQSADMRQMLIKEKFKNVELLSLDRVTTKNNTYKHSIPYILFRTFLYNGKVFLPKSKLLYKECAALLEVGGKIDHPLGGSKDTSDVAAGSAHYWLSKKENNFTQENRMNLYMLGMNQTTEVKPEPVADDKEKKFVPKFII